MAETVVTGRVPHPSPLCKLHPFASAHEGVTLILLKVTLLQHFDVVLVDLKRRSQTDRQACQHVSALHQQQRLPIDLLQGKQHGHIRLG